MDGHCLTNEQILAFSMALFQAERSQATVEKYLRSVRDFFRYLDGRPVAKSVILDPLTVGDESEKQYRISVTCQENAEQEIRLLLINSSSCKTLYLNNLESGDVVGVKVEIVAEYYWDHF